MTHGNPTLNAVLAAGAWVAGGLAYVLAVGWLFDVVRFAAARLPAVATVQHVGAGQLLSRRLLSTLLCCALCRGGWRGVLCFTPKWEVHREESQAIVSMGVAAARAPDAKKHRKPREQKYAEKQALRDSKLERDLRAHHLGRLAGLAARRRNRSVQRAEKLRKTQTQDEPAPRGQPTRAASDEWAIRVVAGFNIMILSAIIGVGVRQESRYRR